MVGIAMLIPLGASAVRRPQFGILLLVALLPYDGLLVLVDLPGVVGGWKEGAVLAIGVAVIANRSGAGTHDRMAIKRRSAPGFWLPTAGLLLLGVASFLATPGIASLSGLKVAYFYLLLPVILWFAPLDSRERDQLITILMVNGVVTSAIGIGQQIMGPEWLNSVGYEYNSQIRFAGGILRTFSTFVQPFPFAFFVMTVLLLGIPIALTDRSRLRNRIFLLAVPLMVVAMASAIVRAALIGFVVGGLYLAASRFRVIAHGGVIGVALILLFPAPITEALGSRSSLDQRTTGWITEIVDEGVEPFGTGIGTVGAVPERLENLAGASSATFPSPPAEGRYQPDNYYVKTLLELGPLGLWLLLWSVMSAIAFSRRIAKAPPSMIEPVDRALAAGITAASASAAVAALVSAYWEIFPVDVFYWLLLGVLPSLLKSSSTLLPSPPEEVASRPTAASSSMLSPA